MYRFTGCLFRWACGSGQLPWSKSWQLLSPCNIHRVNRVNSGIGCCHDDSTISIVLVIIIITVWAQKKLTDKIHYWWLLWCISSCAVLHVASWAVWQWRPTWTRLPQDNPASDIWQVSRSPCIYSQTDQQYFLQVMIQTPLYQCNVNM